MILNLRNQILIKEDFHRSIKEKILQVKAKNDQHIKIQEKYLQVQLQKLIFEREYAHERYMKLVGFSLYGYFFFKF